MNAPLLRVAHLSLAHRPPAYPAHGAAPLVDDVSFDIAPGECLGLIGASGSGKTLTGLAIAGVLPDTVHRRHGTIDVAPLAADHKRAAHERVAETWRTRDHAIAMVFQDPRAALSPVRRIGAQLDDVLRATGMPRGERRAAALALLAEVGLDDPADCLARHAFELSGGMCQRVLIALALARRPRVLIADEPTTGLDTGTQARVLALLRRVTTTRSMAMLLITHDLAVASRCCARIAVMHAGRIVETLPADRLLSEAAHPRSRALIAAMPHTAPDVAALGGDACASSEWERPRVPGRPAPAPTSSPAPTSPPSPAPTSSPLPSPAPGLPGGPLLSVRGVRKHHGPARGRPVLDDVGFDIAPGEAVGIVGRSGCGKSTLAQVLARVTSVDAGRIVFDGTDIAMVDPRRAAGARWRGALQLVFQDVRASLDPLARARDALRAPLRAPDDARIAALAAQVALPLDLLDRRPHALSGGEATRVGLARALASRPRLLLLDEPTASLDMTTQAEIVRTVDTLRRTQGMALLFISHDLELVRLLCTRVLVMDAGRIVESGPCERVLRAPVHPATRALVDARLHAPGEMTDYPSTR